MLMWNLRQKNVNTNLKLVHIRNCMVYYEFIYSVYVIYAEKASLTKSIVFCFISAYNFLLLQQLCINRGNPLHRDLLETIRNSLNLQRCHL